MFVQKTATLAYTLLLEENHKQLHIVITLKYTFIVYLFNSLRKKKPRPFLVWKTHYHFCHKYLSN